MFTYTAFYNICLAHRKNGLTYSFSTLHVFLPKKKMCFLVFSWFFMENLYMDGDVKIEKKKSELRKSYFFGKHMCNRQIIWLQLVKQAKTAKVMKEKLKRWHYYPDLYKSMGGDLSVTGGCSHPILQHIFDLFFFVGPGATTSCYMFIILPQTKLYIHKCQMIMVL